MRGENGVRRPNRNWYLSVSFTKATLVVYEILRKTIIFRTFEHYESKTLQTRQEDKLKQSTLFTMSKTPPEAKHNWVQPFSFKKKDWPDEGNKLKVKLEGKQGGATFDEYVRAFITNLSF